MGRRLCVAALLCSLASGCTSAAVVTHAELGAPRLPTGWRVWCKVDQFKDERRCFAATFGETFYKSKYFQVSFVNGRGPNLEVPNDFPGQIPTVRVDDGPVLDDPTAIVRRMLRGRTAYVVFYVWPDGEKRMTVNLDGFGDAYADLQAQVRGERGHL